MHRIFLAIVMAFFVCTTAKAADMDDLANPAPAYQIERVGVHLMSWHSNPEACMSSVRMRCKNQNPDTASLL